MDCRLNLYDVCCQCCLLQEHLENPRRRCKDCQKKHFLTISGLLNEACALNDPSGIKKKISINDLYLEFQNLHRRYENGDNQNVLAQEVRKFRKKLVKMNLSKPPPYD